MDLRSAAAIANIGSFLLACVLVFREFRWPKEPSHQGNDTMRSSALTNPLMWIFLLGIVSAGYLNYKAATIQSVKPTQPQAKVDEGESPVGVVAKRIFITPTVDAAALAKIVESSTWKVGAKDPSDYIGKWMKFSGRVRYLDRDKDTLYLSFRTERGEPDVDAHFRNLPPSGASSVRVGQTVEIVCQVSEISSRAVRLGSCEFPPRR